MLSKRSFATGDLLGMVPCSNFDSTNFELVIYVGRLSGAWARAMSYRKSDRQQYPSSGNEGGGGRCVGAAGQPGGRNVSLEPVRGPCSVPRTFDGAAHSARTRPAASAS